MTTLDPAPVGHTNGALPFSLPLELRVRDVGTIRQLCEYPEGRECDQFALRAITVRKECRNNQHGDALAFG